MAANRSSIEAGKGHVTLGTDDGPLVKGLEGARNKFRDWSKSVAALGAGISAAGASILSPFAAGLVIFGDRSKEVSRASRELGVGFEDLQTLSGALKTDIDGLGSAIVRMDKLLEQAAQGGVEANAVLTRLGLTFAELNSLSQADRIRRFGSQLAQLADGERIALQRQIFRDVHLNFTGGENGIREREQRVRQIGGVISEHDRAIADGYNKSLKESKIAMAGLWASVGAVAAPAMTEFFKLMTRAIVATKDFIDANRPLFEIIFTVGKTLAFAGAGILALASAVYAGSYAFGALAATLVSVGGVWGLLKAAIILGTPGLATAFTVWRSRAVLGSILSVVGAIGLIPAAIAAAVLAVSAFSGASASAEVGVQAAQPPTITVPVQVQQPDEIVVPVVPVPPVQIPIVQPDPVGVNVAPVPPVPVPVVQPDVIHPQVAPIPPVIVPIQQPDEIRVPVVADTTLWTKALGALSSVYAQAATKFGEPIAGVGAAAIVAATAYAAVTGALRLWVLAATTGSAVAAAATTAWGWATVAASAVASAGLWGFNAAAAALTTVATLVSGAVYGLTSSMIAYDLVNRVAVGSVWAFEAGTLAGSIALGVLSTAVAVVTSGFGLFTAAHWLAAVAGTAFVGVVYGLTGSMVAYDAINKVTTGSMVAFEVGVWLGTAAVASLQAALTFAASGFGLITAATWVYNTALFGIEAAYGAVALATALWSGVSVAAAIAVLTPMLAYGTAITSFQVGYGLAALAAAVWSGANVSGAIAATTALGAYGMVLGGVSVVFWTIAAATTAWGIVTATASTLASGWLAIYGVSLALVEGTLWGMIATSAAWGIATSTWNAIAAAATGLYAAGTVAAMTAVGLIYGASAVIASAWSVATSIAYGVVAGAIMAWAAVSVVSTGVYKGVLLAAAIATTVYALATGGLVAAQSASGLSAWLAAAGTLAMKAAAWLASIATVGFGVAMWNLAAAVTVATGGINLAAVAIAALVVVLIAAAAVVAGAFVVGPIVAVSIAAYGALKGAIQSIGPIAAGIGRMFGMMGRAIAASTAYFGDAVLGAIGRIGGAFSALWPTVQAGFGQLFGSLAETAQQAWAGILNAFAARDFALVWEIVKATALLAWAQITGFVMEQWPAWRSAAVSVFYAITDTIKDVFGAAWINLKIGFVKIWAEMKAVAYEALADIAEQSALPGELGEWQRAQARSLRLDARTAREVAAPRAVQAIEGQAEVDRQLDEGLRWERDDEIGDTQRQLAEANQGGNQAEIVRLQEQLNALNKDAEDESLISWWMDKLTRPDTPGPGNGQFAAGDKGKVSGSFNAQSIFGMLGARYETPQAQQARLMQAQLDLAREEVALLRQILNRVAPRFA